MDMMSLNMNLIVEDMEKEELKENIIDSEEIICPKCNENIIIKIKNYKINTKCKNNHQLSLSFIEFKNSQKIDISKIKCYICNEKNQSNIYNKEMYKCITCNNNICPLCREKHDKNHIIINYDEKYYICNEHNEKYISYCEECKINLCTLCEGHKNHKRILYADYLPKNEELIEKKNELKSYIHQFNSEINSIISMLNDVKNKMNIYYKINEDIIDNYNNKNRNYEIIYNINNINNINDLNNIKII